MRMKLPKLRIIDGNAKIRKLAKAAKMQKSAASFRDDITMYRSLGNHRMVAAPQSQI